jgi:hypothetical protein
MSGKPLWIVVLLSLVCHTTTPLFAGQGPPALTEDPQPIRYIEQKPEEGSPQDIMLKIFFLREEGKSEEAAKYLSADLPNWLRESLLKKHFSEENPLKMETLRYQLKKGRWDDKWLVDLSYNLADGTYRSGDRYPVWEGNQWKIK